MAWVPLVKRLRLVKNNKDALQWYNLGRTSGLMVLPHSTGLLRAGILGGGALATKPPASQT